MSYCVTCMSRPCIFFLCAAVSTIAGVLMAGADWSVADEPADSIAELDRLVESNPFLPTARAARARFHFERGDWDKAVADVQEAIRTNPDDVGKDYEATTGSELSAEALKHGEEQVRRMLQDRPAMAEHVSAGDKLWGWAVRKFAGEDLGSLIDWDPTDPSPAEAIFLPSGDDRHSRIVVRDIRGDSSKSRAFDRLWARTVFEFHNAALTKEWVRIPQLAAEGALSRDEYVLAQIDAEERSMQRTRSFYVNPTYSPAMFHTANRVA